MKTIIDGTVISYNNDVELSNKIKDLREAQRIKVECITNDIYSRGVAPKKEVETEPTTPEDPKELEIHTETTISNELEIPEDPVAPDEPETLIDTKEPEVEAKGEEENTTLLDESLDESSKELDKEESKEKEESNSGKKTK